MPKSKREKLLHLTQVSKKTREHKERLFSNIRDEIPNYAYCYVLRVENMRNQHLRDLRQALPKSRLFLGKTKLMARALGTTPEEAQAPGLDRLAVRFLRGAVGLLLSDSPAAELQPILEALCPVDFARAGVVAPRDIYLPRGVLYSTGGEVPAADDVPLAAALEPELRRLGVPTRLRDGLVVLEGPIAPPRASDEMADGVDPIVAIEGADLSRGYCICREGQTLDARQTRLLRLFNICLVEFHVSALAYWSAATEEITELAAPLLEAKVVTVAAPDRKKKKKKKAAAAAAATATATSEDGASDEENDNVGDGIEEIEVDE